VCLAIAISLSPKIIVADELTSALDVVVQRQVMLTLGQLQENLGASVLLVGHDMGLMAQFVDRIGMLYAGKLVEVGPVREVFKEPLHPYTQLLIDCLPSLEAKRRFKGIPGLAPLLLNPPSGCTFHPRCPQAMSRCSLEVPRLEEVSPGRRVACHLYTGDKK
jgi:peptide/nickel transport system ATP-binding protein